MKSKRILEWLTTKTYRLELRDQATPQKDERPYISPKENRHLIWASRIRLTHSTGEAHFSWNGLSQIRDRDTMPRVLEGEAGHVSALPFSAIENYEALFGRSDVLEASVCKSKNQSRMWWG